MEQGDNEESKGVELDWSHPDSWLICLAVADQQFDRYNNDKDPRYLDAAIRNTNIALNKVQQSVDQKLDTADYLANLGTMYLTRFEITGVQADLQLATKASREAYGQCDTSHASYPQICYMLSKTLAVEYEQTSRGPLLLESIALADTSIKEGDETNSELYAEFLTNLSSRLLNRFDELSAPEDLEMAVELSEKAIEIANVPCSSLPVWLSCLGNALWSRFEFSGDENDLDRSIDCSRTAMKYAELFEQPVYGYLANLCSQLVRHHERTGDADSLQEAIVGAERAYNNVDKSHVSAASLLLNLGSTIRSQFHSSGDIVHLDRAISLVQEAWKLLPVGHTEQVKVLASLCNLFMIRFEHTGRYDSLKKALQYKQDFMKCVIPNSRLWSKVLLDASLLSYYDYEWNGDEAQLEEALAYIARAIDATNTEDLDFAMMLSTQAMLLVRRFERDGRRADLDEAARIGRKAIGKTPPGHPNKPQRLNSLGIMFQIANKRSHDVEDLRRSIDAFATAINEVKDGSAMLSSLKINQSNTYMRIFETTKDEKSLEKSLELIEKIDPQSIPNQQQRARLLSTMSLNLQARAKSKLPLESEIVKVTQLAKEALSQSSSDHPDRAVMLRNLGECLILSKDKVLRSQALQYYLKAWECENGLPIYRLEAAQAYLFTFQQLSIEDDSGSQLDYAYAKDVAKSAVLLLTSIGNVSLAQQDKQAVLSSGAGVASMACSLILEVGESVEESLDILEMGRGVIVGQLLDRHHDLTALRRVDAAIAARFEKLRKDANVSFDGFENEANDKLRQAMQNRRLQASRKLQELTNEIRKLPTMQRFLLGPDEIQRHNLSMRSHQTLVVINITWLRSDGIIVTPKGTKHLPLEELHYKTVREWLNQSLTRYKGMKEFMAKNKAYLGFLEWLWKVCVEPIIQELSQIQVTALDSTNPYRICWIGTGIGSQLPFHAAGIYSKNAGTDALTKLISSYTPSFKVLAWAVARMGETTSQTDMDSLLSVLMPTTPNADDLDSVEEEDRLIRQQLEPRVKVKTERHPSTQAILSQLEKYSMIHFACHGVNSVLEPMQGHLILQRTIDSGVTAAESQADPLTVRAISDRDLQGKRLAVLSACSTAENPSIRLADEVLHLASGFHVAGFLHIVATMWRTDDDVSVQFASQFYKTIGHFITKSDMGISWPVAEAVRATTLQLCHQMPTRPLLWAQYVHWGL